MYQFYTQNQANATATNAYYNRSIVHQPNIMIDIPISDMIFQIDEQNLDNLKNKEQPYLNIYDCCHSGNFNMY